MQQTVQIPKNSSHTIYPKQNISNQPYEQNENSIQNCLLKNITNELFNTNE